MGSDAKLVVSSAMEKQNRFSGDWPRQARASSSSFPSQHQAAQSTRMRSKSNFARPLHDIVGECLASGQESRKT